MDSKVNIRTRSARALFGVAKGAVEGQLLGEEAEHAERGEPDEEGSPPRCAAGLLGLPSQLIEGVEVTLEDVARAQEGRSPHCNSRSRSREGGSPGLRREGPKRKPR